MSNKYICIPTKLENKLKEDQGLHGKVLIALTTFCDWIFHSNFVFFPEYTDHGLKHIEAVLSDAEALITDETWEIFTPKDAAALILAILLHDAAMHITEDGFISLVTDEQYYKQYIVNELDEKSWKDLYSDFFRDMKRLDDKKLKSLFNDTNPIKPPPLNKQDMTRRDRILIGEFLRRYHHRLAHEIALYGVPKPISKEDETIERLKIDGLEEDDLNIIGMIARSHGMDLRDASDFLININASGDDGGGIHTEYLMILLRISDYIQIQAERAPEVMHKVQRLESSISKQEWKFHNVKIKRKETTKDKHAIEYNIVPKNVKDVITYLKIKDYFDGLQKELDTSWAVLGEVYSLQPKCSKLGLTIRRVRSNINDKKTFKSKVKFVPDKISFNLAHSRILKLLVKPLYGDRPEIGIRELIQNAVDAVRERWAYEGKTPEDASDPKGDVIISLDEDDNGWFVEVKDNGIGMTVDDVKNYFLNVGASFKDSQFFSEKFRDDEGKSNVLRSGRFGIGILAAFLLCDENYGELHNQIHVATRHMDEKKGIRFTTSLSEDVIEIVNKVDIDVGTKVKVYISKKVRNKLTSIHNFTPITIPIKKKDFNNCNDENIIKKLLKANILVLDEKNHQYFKFNLSEDNEQQGLNEDILSKKLYQLKHDKQDIDIILSLFRKSHCNQMWDWYALNEPKVVRKIENSIIVQRFNFPNTLEALPLGFHRIKFPDYQDIHWTYNRLNIDGNLILINGIIIMRDSYKVGLISPNKS